MPRLIHSLLLVLLAFTAPAFGWGEEGHRVIGWIAYQRLTPEAKAEVDRLLALESSNLPEACFWADAVARKQTQFRFANQLHYANVPRGETAYAPERDRPPGGDVVSGIERYRAVLADRTKSDSERLEALRFLAHFVGDIHQPLHVGHKEDKGGNDLQVRFFDRGTNLHAVWDTGILQRSGSQWEQLARKLHSGISPEAVRKHAAQMDPEAWAQEAYTLAVEHVYAGVSAGAKLGQAYVDQKMPLVEARLTVAGVRLAEILNATLAGGPASSSIAAPEPVTALAIVFVTKSGKKYHRADCRHLTATRTEISLADAKQRYEACKVCRPPK